MAHGSADVAEGYGSRAVSGVGVRLELGLTRRHDPIALARARRQEAVVSHLMGSRWRDQRDETVDQLASLHLNVRGAVAPAGLQAKRESAVGLLLEAIVRGRRAGHIAAQTLEAAAVAGGDGHGSVEAHAALLGYAGRGVRILARLCGIHAVSHTPPWRTPVWPGGNARAQGGRGEQREERLVSGEYIVILLCVGFEQPMESASRSGEHPGYFVMAGWGQDEEAPRLLVTGGVRIRAVESQRVEVKVQVQRRAEALDEGGGAARLGESAPSSPNAPSQLREERPQEGAKHLCEPPVVTGMLAALSMRVRSALGLRARAFR
jgi:hypothetical protein